MPAGEVVARPIACDTEQIPGGEGRVSDLRLANAVASVVLRHPVDALTVRAGGVTVLDAAPWGRSDRLHEIVPLVGGGWLEVAEVDTRDGRVEVTGTVVSFLADRPAAAEGERRTVRYVLHPDDPWLNIEGAEGLYVNPQGDVEVFDRAIVAGSVLYGWDAGGRVEDLGGALILTGTSRLLISDPSVGWDELAGPDGVLAEGLAPEADSLLLMASGRPVGRLDLQDDAFSVVLPREVDALRAEASGRAPSDPVAPGAGLDLRVGGGASVTLHPSWLHQSRPLAVDWSSDDGRGAEVLLGAEGGTLSLGAGVHTLTISAGAAYQPQTVRLELHDGDQDELGVLLTPTLDPGPWVQVGVGSPCDRERTWRGTNLAAGERAAADGLVWTVFTATDDVPGVTSSRAWPALLIQDGVRWQGDGWTVTSWPWQQQSRKALHGGVQQGDLGPEDAAAALTGGLDNDRWLLVDLGWLSAVAPLEPGPRPDFVSLGAPGPDASAWAAWFDWLDSGRAVVPQGPITWVPVLDPSALGPADVEQPLIKGHVVAGTGPILELRVDGLPPGETLSATEELRTLSVTVLGGAGVDRIRLLRSGGAVLAELGARGGTLERELPAGWVVALATGPDDWAVTGPVWISPVP